QRAVCGRMFDMMRGLKPDIQIPGGVPAACIPHANGLHALAKCFLRARIDATFGAILLPRLENWSRGRALSMDVFQVGGAKCNMFRVFALRRCDGRRNGRRRGFVGFRDDRRDLRLCCLLGLPLRLWLRLGSLSSPRSAATGEELQDTGRAEECEDFNAKGAAPVIYPRNEEFCRRSCILAVLVLELVTKQDDSIG